MWCNYCNTELKLDVEHKHVKECEKKSGYTSLFSYKHCCLCFETLDKHNIAKQHPLQDICQDCFNKENK